MPKINIDPLSWGKQGNGSLFDYTPLALQIKQGTDLCLTQKDNSMNNKINFRNIIGWIFGIIVFVDGILNLCWGNDFGLGVAFLLLSFIFFPPTSTFLNIFIKKKFDLSIPWIIKIVLGILIIWITLAVGALVEG